MTLDLERQQIEARYKANAIVGVEVAYDGFPLKLVDPTTELPNLPAIRLTINSGRRDQVSIGAPSANITRNAGIATFEIYTEGGQGTVEVNGIANAIMDIFRNQNLGVVRCKIPYPTTPDTEEPYEKLNVVVPYQRDALNA